MYSWTHQQRLYIICIIIIIVAVVVIIITNIIKDYVRKISFFILLPQRLFNNEAVFSFFKFKFIYQVLFGLDCLLHH